MGIGKVGNHGRQGGNVNNQQTWVNGVMAQRTKVVITVVGVVEYRAVSETGMGCVRRGR